MILVVGATGPLGSTVEEHGPMLVPGPAAAGQGFLSVHDAARVLAAVAVTDTLSGAVEAGGPESLSWTASRCCARRRPGNPWVRSRAARGPACPAPRR